ncbi:MAG: hypothetical protein KAT70_10050, partial [Thermoplasmata archaeon]|nr:hypothetical protein [Thermoplasmata archaeon]
YVLGIEGQRVQITKEMLSFTTKLPENIFEGKVDGGSVYVDAEMTDVLMGEAYCREIIRRIQQMRKEVDLKVEDMIEARLFVDNDMADLLMEWGEHIAIQTRSQLLEFLAGPPDEGYVVEWTIDGRQVVIGIMGLVYEEEAESAEEAREVEEAKEALLERHVHASPQQMVAVAEEVTTFEKEHHTLASAAPEAEIVSKPEPVSKSAQTGPGKETEAVVPDEGTEAVVPEEKPGKETPEPAGPEELASKEEITGEEEPVEPMGSTLGEKAMSLLLQVSGIGEKKAQTIIDAGFDSYQKICSADPKELSKVKGVNKKGARRIIASVKEMRETGEEEEGVRCPVCGATVKETDHACPRCNTMLLEPESHPPTSTKKDAGKKEKPDGKPGKKGG